MFLVVSVAIVCVALPGPPASGATGGMRAAMQMPFGEGAYTGYESPSTHHHFFSSGFAWDLLKNLGQPVSARFASSDGAVTIRVGRITAGSNDAGKTVEVKVKVSGTVVGTVWFSHLKKLQVSENSDYASSRLLGYTGDGTFPNANQCGPGRTAYGFKYSKSYQVCTPGGVHTHVDVSRGCWRSMGLHEGVGATVPIVMLSTNFGPTNNSACDTAELDAVSRGVQAPPFDSATAQTGDSGCAAFPVYTGTAGTSAGHASVLLDFRGSCAAQSYGYSAMYFYKHVAAVAHDGDRVHAALRYKVNSVNLRTTTGSGTFHADIGFDFTDSESASFPNVRFPDSEDGHTSQPHIHARAPLNLRVHPPNSSPGSTNSRSMAWLPAMDRPRALLTTCAHS